MLKSHNGTAQMISQTTEHALRALLYLARNSKAPVPATEIASAIGAPANYLGKTLQTLARRGYVTGVRGPTGGFRLAVDASEISIAAIGSVFSDTQRSRMCLLGGKACSSEQPCSAHDRWSQLQIAIAKQMDETTVADLAGQTAACSAAL